MAHWQVWLEKGGVVGVGAYWKVLALFMCSVVLPMLAEEFGVMKQGAMVNVVNQACGE